jgi:hypothetical protein
MITESVLKVPLSGKMADWLLESVKIGAASVRKKLTVVAEAALIIWHP